MPIKHSFLLILVSCGMASALVACGEPRAVMLPLQYPDGTMVTTAKGEPVMAGYQTYGSSMHANATALYENAKPPTCVTCAKLSAVVTEPSVLRQVTGVLGTTTIGAGAVMTGVGVMDYGIAAGEGKLGSNITQNSTVSQQSSRHGNGGGIEGRGGYDRDNANRFSNAAPQHPDNHPRNPTDDRGFPHNREGNLDQHRNFSDSPPPQHDRNGRESLNDNGVPHNREGNLDQHRNFSDASPSQHDGRNSGNDNGMSHNKDDSWNRRGENSSAWSWNSASATSRTGQGERVPFYGGD